MNLYGYVVNYKCVKVQSYASYGSGSTSWICRDTGMLQRAKGCRYPSTPGIC